jgi:hypothetical protein
MWFFCHMALFSLILRAGAFAALGARDSGRFFAWQELGSDWRSELSE